MHFFFCYVLLEICGSVRYAGSPLFGRAAHACERNSGCVGGGGQEGVASRAKKLRQTNTQCCWSVDQRWRLAKQRLLQLCEGAGQGSEQGKTYRRYVRTKRGRGMWVVWELSREGAPPKKHTPLLTLKYNDAIQLSIFFYQS